MRAVGWDTANEKISGEWRTQWKTVGRGREARDEKARGWGRCERASNLGSLGGGAAFPRGVTISRE